MTLAIDSKMNVHTAACIRLALVRFPAVQQIWTYAAFPDHNNGRCCDYMITIEGMPRTDQVALGDAIADWHIRHADELGVNWIIWNRRIYRHANTNKGHGWAVYTGPKSHTDHVHVEYDGTPPTLTGAPPYLPARIVTEGLWAAHEDKPSKWRGPGYEVNTLTKIEGDWGRTETGYIYPLLYTHPKETQQ